MNNHSPREDYMQEEILHLNKNKQGSMRGLILFAESSKFSSLRNHVGQKWCTCCCLLCLENHASASGFSKKVFLIQSNGCKRGKKKKGSGSQ